MTVPRPEHPRPRLTRPSWRSLNGPCDFARDDRAELGAPPPEGAAYDREIVVPFPPESALSGIGETGFQTSLWYRRRVQIPRDWDGLRVFLHVGACDYAADVFLDGARLGEHVGGSAPFRVDLTGVARPGGTVLRATAIESAGVRNDATDTLRRAERPDM